MTPECSQRPQWRKNLYENTEYDDNYTDPTFLKDLRTNLNVRFYSFSEAVRGVTRLSNQISCITAFLIEFYMLYSGQWAPSAILLPTSLSTAIGYFCCRRERVIKGGYLIDDLKTLLTVLVFGYLFAPVMHGLTNAISTDTIFSMTFVVMLLNLIFYDYGLSVAMVSKTVSLNAAIFGAICLASRLATSFHAFVLLVQAAIMFVLYPIFVEHYWRWHFIVPIFISCFYFLYHLSHTVLWLYVIGIVFINFICPLIFVIVQQHKHNIHGPWDEAIVVEQD